MAGIKSNFKEAIAPTIRELTHALDANRSSRGHRVGDEMANIVAVGIIQRTEHEQLGPDGGPLPRPSRRTLLRKARKGYSLKIGVETGEMLSFEEIKGQVTIDANTVVMTAGTDEETRDKVDWFTKGDPKRNRPARKFYELDDRITGNLDDYAEEVIEAKIRDLGGA